MDESQRDVERGQTIEQLKHIDQRLTSIESKVSSLVSDSAERQRQCWNALESKLVSRAEFVPVQKIVYGVVALVCVGVVTGVLALVVRAG
jgi:thiosulfate reductase cytochrome b subunit